MGIERDERAVVDLLPANLVDAPPDDPGIPLDSLNRIINVMQTTYGFDVGSVEPVQRETPLANLFGRLDFQISPQHRLAFRQIINHDQQDQFFRSATNNYSADPLTQNSGFRFTTNQFAFDSKNTSSTLQLYSNFSGGMANELIVGYSTIKDARSVPVQAPEVTVGVQVGTARRAVTFGTEQFSPNNLLDQKIFEVVNNFTMPMGSHTWTFGGRIDRTHIFNNFAQGAFGVYNFPTIAALEAVLAHIAGQNVDEVYCLGDVVGYGPNPCECLDLVIERCKVGRLGNHDQGAMFDPEGFNSGAERAIFWTRQMLEQGDPADIERRWEFLGELPRMRREGEFLYVHGSARNPLNEYVFPEDVYNQRKMERIFGLVDHYCFQGHTHIPGVFTEDATFQSPEEFGHRWKLAEQKVLVNVGSVGQPRDGNNRACYIVLHPAGSPGANGAASAAQPTGETGTFTAGTVIEYRRVPYEFEKTIAKIYGIPELDNFLGDRLRDVQVAQADLSLTNIAATQGKVRIISVVPSLDTKVCEQQTHYLSEKNNGLDKAVELTTAEWKYVLCLQEVDEKGRPAGGSLETSAVALLPGATTLKKAYDAGLNGCYNASKSRKAVFYVVPAFVGTPARWWSSRQA